MSVERGQFIVYIYQDDQLKTQYIINLLQENLFEDMKTHEMDLEQSVSMDQKQLNLFLNPRKSKSDDLFLGKLIANKSEMQRRPLLFDLPKSIEKGSVRDGVSVFRRRIKKEKKPKLCDYRKNICGYITKKIIREFVGQTFLDTVTVLCGKYHCLYQQCRSYYLSQIEHITGPTHVANLLNVSLSNSKERKFKRSFRQFFGWFLRERYIRYLIAEGKMANKQAYIEYKNMFLLPLLNEVQQQGKKQQQDNLKMEEELQQIQTQFSRKRRTMSRSKGS